MGRNAMSVGRTVRSAACVAEGADWLRGVDPAFDRALDKTGPLPLRLKPDGFATLLSAIVAQQVSVASARAINKRLEDAELTTPQAVVSAGDARLRELGLSRPKARYALALAGAKIDYGALHAMPTQEVIKTLTAVTGIGVWTAEIYAKFSLGRADVLAAGDLALQEGARMVFDLPTRPSEKDLRAMAEAWSPWRSVAARLLWAYYAIEKSREGVT